MAIAQAVDCLNESKPGSVPRLSELSSSSLSKRNLSTTPLQLPSMSSGQLMVMVLASTQYQLPKIAP